MNEININKNLEKVTIKFFYLVPCVILNIIVSVCNKNVTMCNVEKKIN